MAKTALDYDDFVVKPGKQISLAKDFSPSYKSDAFDKVQGKARLAETVGEMAALQNVLYAQNTYALLIIFQAMDAAGKDGTIKHVMSGVNPQGCQVFSFKAPSSEELDHDYLWRSMKTLPERGRIGIYNRSYYEEVLITRVHPAILDRQQLPPHKVDKQFWQQRFDQINNFEQYLTANGVIVLKFFLNVSKAEQKTRFMERLDNPEKNWKFSMQDVKERQHWDDYQNAYEDMFNHTSTKAAPWHVIPADRKWFMRMVVSEIICEKLRSLDLQYPQLTDAQMSQLGAAKQQLLDEPD
ncbi:polyphosphate kinase 2 family protein [filamentous cyanobacterium LEGE 11480]|uniref:Polyphosphate kinase 2 family protein n=1 Tax=Romeriopsis navalis LEGE 11480 TaxID=2777977 RepID=A0A928VJT0_9CYAN|nr:polyphosphate kinase 2 family protein [Romeriopsis navalis]MBE9029640.1 polyphosphate kinase 2 family protein [Romeriopsis navalis LEGE 11480]